MTQYKGFLIMDDCQAIVVFSDDINTLAILGKLCDMIAHNFDTHYANRKVGQPFPNVLAYSKLELFSREVAEGTRAMYKAHCETVKNFSDDGTQATTLFDEVISIERVYKI